MKNSIMMKANNGNEKEPKYVVSDFTFLGDHKADGESNTGKASGQLRKYQIFSPNRLTMKRHALLLLSLHFYISTSHFEAQLNSVSDNTDDHRRPRFTGTNESEKEREFKGIINDLTSYKVQLEAKDAVYMQALLKLQHHKYTADELSTLLQTIETERDAYIRECKEASTRVEELESKVHEMADQLSENAKLREQLKCVFSELRDTQEKLVSAETEHARARESEIKAIMQAELMEIAFTVEKERAEELLSKSECIEMLKHEIKELNDRLIFSEKAASDNMKMVNDVNQDALIESLEVELSHLSQELINANEVADHLKVDIELLTDELLEAGREIGAVKQRETNALVAAAEARMHNMESRMHLADQELVLLEAEENVEASSEIEERNAGEDQEDTKQMDDAQLITISRNEYARLIKNTDQIHLSSDNVHSFSTQSSSSVTDDKSELQKLKKKLEAASIKVSHFRSRAEQAVTRADVAERAKAGLEDQVRGWRELRQKRKAALKALKEVSAIKEYGYHAPQEFNFPEYDEIEKENPPLGQVLNLKF